MMNVAQSPESVGQLKTVKSAPQSHILELLHDLPPESLVVVEQFIQFLRHQAQQGQPVVTVFDQPAPPYRYPTVPLSISALNGLVGIMPPIAGDALADTEALYNEV